MSKDGRHRERQGTVDDAEIGMTNATVTNADKNLAGARIVDLDSLDDIESPARLGENRRPHRSHGLASAGCSTRMTLRMLNSSIPQSPSS
jgi:hypothetical protein